MEFLRSFIANSQLTGRELVRFEAEKLGLANKPTLIDIKIMTQRANKLGEITGLDENQQTSELIKGANSSRGLRNELVRGLRL